MKQNSDLSKWVTQRTQELQYLRMLSMSSKDLFRDSLSKLLGVIYLNRKDHKCCRPIQNPLTDVENISV